MIKIFQKPKTIFKTILDVILPPVCYVCGKNCSGQYGLCDSCLGSIRYILPPYCPKCGRRLLDSATLCGECESRKSYIERAYSCCYYQSPVKDCVHLFKYRGFVGLVDIFRDIMAGFAERNKIPEVVDLIVPVPIFSSKRRERSYNHAEILARSLSKRLLIPMDTKTLKKIKWTSSQSELDKAERLENVRDTFLAVDKNAFSGKSVLIVDDVYTTGATINECAKTLLWAKASKVYSLTLARGA